MAGRTSILVQLRLLLLIQGFVAILSVPRNVTIDFTVGNLMQYTPQNPFIFYDGDNMIIPCIQNETYAVLRLEDQSDYESCNSTCTRSRVLGTCHAGLLMNVTRMISITEMRLTAIIPYEANKIYYITSLANCHVLACENCGDQILSMGLCANNLKFAMQVQELSVTTLQDSAIVTDPEINSSGGLEPQSTLSLTIIIIIAAVGGAFLLIIVLVAIAAIVFCAYKKNKISQVKEVKDVEALSTFKTSGDGLKDGLDGSSDKNKELGKSKKSGKNLKDNKFPNRAGYADKNNVQADGAPGKKDLHNTKKDSSRNGGKTQNKQLKKIDDKKDAAFKTQPNSSAGSARDYKGNNRAANMTSTSTKPASRLSSGSTEKNGKTAVSASTKQSSDKNKLGGSHQTGQKTTLKSATQSPATSLPVASGHFKEKKTAAVSSSVTPTNTESNVKKPLYKAPSAPPTNKQTKPPTYRQARDAQSPSVSSSVPPSGNIKLKNDSSVLYSVQPRRQKTRPSKSSNDSPSLTKATPARSAPKPPNK